MTIDARKKSVKAQQEVVLDHAQKAVVYHAAYTRFVEVPLSAVACDKHKVEHGTVRLEAHTTCQFCKMEMKSEWLPLHIAQNHKLDTVSLDWHTFLDVFVNDDGSLYVPEPVQVREIKRTSAELLKAARQAMTI